LSVHALHLVWKRIDGDDVREDVELGTCYNTSRPGAGELINFVSKAVEGQRGVWKVVLVYHQPFMEGSMTYTKWRARNEHPEDMTTYWVEPAEGPWEP
jgi:hypothetical protein